MSYADAINAALEYHREELRDYGRLLAQSGTPLSDIIAPAQDAPYIAQGYAEQLADFPNG
jgi:hypothetical protein